MPPIVGEIKMFAGNFAPAGWMFCEGQLLPISENETLFNLIGTTYGGDGQVNFALPDLRGRVPIHNSSNNILAEQGGVEEVTLTVNQIPNHGHALMAVSSPASSKNPLNGILASSANSLLYRAGVNTPVPMNSASNSVTGGSQPHSNFQSYLCINFIISLFGIFPDF